MFLKSLDIFGFKSFSDRTHIEFADGITALLGPNGCGKSNVVDAVKWVLGEQGAKNMRADKMEDVIFNGTENRKALNVAEVALTIANDNGLLPLEQSEVTIKRRLYRSGEGEYWINNEQVRLKKVRELFWDTGIGKAAYSVMEQGKIDQILSSKPEDRRYLFEEAAGITRFKVKRAEAERKLLRTQDNMKQVEVVLSEVKRSHDSLKIQADKTQKYRELKDSVFNYELDIQLLKLKGFVLDRKNRKEDVLQLEEERNSIQKNIDTLRKELSSNMDEVNDMETTLSTLQKRTISLAVEEKGKHEQEKMLEVRRNEAREKVHQLEGKKCGLEERIDSLTEDTDEKEATLHDSKKRLEEIAKNILAFEENIELSSHQITENTKKSNDYAFEIKELEKKRFDLQEVLESITENIVTELDSKLKDAGYSTASAKKAKENFDEKIGQLRVLASGRKNIFLDFASLSSPSGAESKKFGEKASQTFSEIEEKVTEIEKAAKEFSKTTPSFIEEFLSPEGIITKKRDIDAKIQSNTESVEEKKGKILVLKNQNEELSAKINQYRETLEELRINQAQMKARVQSAEDQLKLLRRELSLQENALRDLEDELFNEQKRFEDIEDELLELQGEIASIQREGIKLTEKLEELEKSIKTRNSDVAGKRGQLESFTEKLSSVQIKIERYHLQLATGETEIRNIKENFRDTHSRDLMEFEDRMESISLQPAQLRECLTKDKNALRNLGQVNLMALEEFAETKDRYDFLSSQFADLQKAREDLLRITEEIKAESTEMFLETYNKIKKNFHNMFRRLFGGGRGELRLVDPQNVLTSGIDIFAQPPGKKLENIALLSGGEKTMTAVALLFATYMVRPSPFCLLDEIDAALDEQNVLRFVQMLREFGNMSQYIVITHNKKTVGAASTMLGVTMEESGVSKVITIKLEDGARVYIPDPEPFEDEDVEPEENVIIPPHPPKRIHNADGSISDPFMDDLKKREKQRKKEERERKKAEAATLKVSQEEERARIELELTKKDVFSDGGPKGGVILAEIDTVESQGIEEYHEKDTVV